MTRRARPSWRFARKRLREALATVDCAVIGHAKAKDDVGCCVACGVMETRLRGNLTFRLEGGPIDQRTYDLLAGNATGVVRYIPLTPPEFVASAPRGGIHYDRNRSGWER